MRCNKVVKILVEIGNGHAVTVVPVQAELNPAITADGYLERFRNSCRIQASHRLQPLAELF